MISELGFRIICSPCLCHTFICCYSCVMVPMDGLFNSSRASRRHLHSLPISLELRVLILQQCCTLLHDFILKLYVGLNYLGIYSEN